MELRTPVEMLALNGKRGRCPLQVLGKGEIMGGDGDQVQSEKLQKIKPDGLKFLSGETY